MSSNQLILFKGIDVKKLDSCLSELQNFVYDMKHLALLIETSVTRNRAFNMALETSRASAAICEDLSDLSFKYMDWTPEMWRKITVYEPYYAALEPRSPFRLYEIANSYKSRCKAILLRLRACLEKGGIKPPMELIYNLEKCISKLTNLLKLEGFEL